MRVFFLCFCTFVVIYTAFLIRKCFFRENSDVLPLAIFLLIIYPYVLSIFGFLNLYTLIFITLLGFGLVRSRVNSLTKQNINSNTEIILELPSVSRNSLLPWGIVVSSIIIGSYMFWPLLKKMGVHLLEVHPLNSDVLSSSMPALIDIIQSGSMWTQKAFYSHYLLGFAFVQMWGHIFLLNEAVFSIYYYFFFFLLIFYALKTYIFLFQGKDIDSIPHGNQASKKISFMTLATTLLLFFLLLNHPIITMTIHAFGKTDLPVTALAMSSFYYFIRLVVDIQDKVSSKEITKGTHVLGINFFCMISIKPQSFYLMALLGLVLLFKKVGLKNMFFLGSWQLLQAPLYMRLVLGTDAATRQVSKETAPLYALFSPPDPKKFDAFFPGLPGNDFQTIFYGAHPFNFMVLGLIVLGVVGLILYRKYDDKLRILTITLLISIFVFSISPMGVWYPALNIRYGLLLIPFMVLFPLANFAYFFRSKFEFNENAKAIKFNSSSSMSIYCFSFMFIALLFFQGTFYKPTAGFNGYSGYADPTPSKVSQYINDHIENKKIFFVWVRPYGLHGKGFTNQLFYNRNLPFKGLGDGTKRWLLGLAHTQTNYFVFKSYDKKLNFEHNGPPKEIRDLLKEKEYLELEFSDQFGAIVKVKKPLSEEDILSRFP
jgi:hypothetical protein